MRCGTGRLTGRIFFCWLILALAVLAAAAAHATTAKTLIMDVLYRADGTPAQGTLLISWPAFTTAGGDAVAAGAMAVKLGAGGTLEAAVFPNTGSTPQGTYYKVLLDLDDGTRNTEYWVVPQVTQTTIAAVRSLLVPQSQAMQFVGRDYVDTAIAGVVASGVELTGDQTIAGVKTFQSSPQVPTPVNAGDAANRQFVLDAANSAATAQAQAGSGTVNASQYQINGIALSSANLSDGASLARISQLPTETSQLVNNSGFISASGAPVQSVNGMTGAVSLTIPAAQVNSDWNASSGVAQILNKPALGSAAAQNTTAFDAAGAATALLSSANTWTQNQTFNGSVAVGATNPVRIGGATGSCAGKVAMADGTGCVAASAGGSPVDGILYGSQNGVVCNGMFNYSGYMNQGSTTVGITDGSGFFSKVSPGMLIEVDGAGAGGGPLRTTVVSVASGGASAVLAAPAAAQANGGNSIVVGTDTTTAIQALINTAVANGGGKIVLPLGTCILNGAVGAGVGGSQNAILPLPYLVSSGTSVNTLVSLEISGRQIPVMAYPESGGQKTLPGSASTILYAMSSASGSNPAILGGPQIAGYSTMLLYVHDLALRQPPNPYFTDIDATHVANALVERVSSEVNIGNLTTGVPQPTNTSAIGISLPNEGNYGDSVLRDSYVVGHYIGVYGAEHAVLDHVFLQQNWICYESNGGNSSSHVQELRNVLMQWCPYDIYGLAGNEYITGVIDIEDQTAGWSAPIDHIYSVSSGGLAGYLKVNREVVGIGFTDAPLTTHNVTSTLAIDYVGSGSRNLNALNAQSVSINGASSGSYVKADGTGYGTPSGGGGGLTPISTKQTGLSAALGGQTLTTPTAAGQYMICMTAIARSCTGCAGTVQPYVSWNYNSVNGAPGVGHNLSLTGTLNSETASSGTANCLTFVADNTGSIAYGASVSGGSGAYTYDLWVSLVQLQ